MLALATYVGCLHLLPSVLRFTDDIQPGEFGSYQRLLLTPPPACLLLHIMMAIVYLPFISQPLLSTNVVQVCQCCGLRWLPSVFSFVTCLQLPQVLLPCRLLVAWVPAAVAVLVGLLPCLYDRLDTYSESAMFLARSTAPAATCNKGREHIRQLVLSMVPSCS